ncbi:MAG: biotin/lipoyl-containing protein [Anaerolineales bacterium]
MPVYHVTIGDQEYTVEIENPRERPVRAIVNGEPLEVHVEEGAVTATASTTEALEPPVSTVNTAVRTPTRMPAVGAGSVTAPLPGTVVSINVQEGDSIEPGQELCILEAMKMNNPIRATMSGTVKEVHIQVGQQVQHGAPLFTIE